MAGVEKTLRVGRRAIIREGDIVKVRSESIDKWGRRFGPSGVCRVQSICDDGQGFYAVFEKRPLVVEYVYTGPVRENADTGSVYRPARVSRKRVKGV